jgi:hypothetical protein
VQLAAPFKNIRTEADAWNLLYFQAVGWSEPPQWYGTPMSNRISEVWQPHAKRLLLRLDPWAVMVEGRLKAATAAKVYSMRQ